MSSYGIPEELTYESLSRLYPSVKSEYRKNPVNGGSAFSSGDIQLRINKMPRSFINPATLSLNFRVAQKFVYGATAPAAAGADVVMILGNALSFFSQQVVKPVSGQWQDTITYPGLIANTIMNLTTSPIEKNGMIAFGFNSLDGVSTGYTNTGDYVVNQGTTATTTETIYRSYSVPLLGILNTHKLIPLFCDEIEIDFTVNSQANFIQTFIATANATYGGFAIDDVEIVGDVLTLEESGFNELLKMYPNGMSIKTESYLYGSSSLPAQGKGSYDITYSHGLNSLKKFIWWASPTGQWEGNYGGVNPNLQNWQLFIGSTAYPQLPVKSYSLAEVFYQNQKSFGAFVSTAHCGSCDRYSMSKCSLPATGSKYTAEYIAYTSTKPSVANAIKSPYANKYSSTLDLELINQMKNTLYSGISTKGSSNLMRLTVAETLANVVHNITYYSVYDAVITFDFVNGQIFAST
jgi:hypothetical protein